MNTDPKNLALISATDRTLSKEETTFNSRLKRVQKLRAELEEYKATLEHYARRGAHELEPIETQVSGLVLQRLLRMMEYAKSPALKTEKARDKVRTVMDALFGEYIEVLEPGPDAKALYEFITGGSYEESMAEAKEQEQAFFKKFAAQHFGDTGIDWESVNLDDDAEMAQKLRQAQDAARERGDQQPNKSGASKGKGTTKREELEAARKQLEERSLKEIYRRLALALHPDKALDEKEKERLEEGMKRLTAAYSSKNLPALLQLEMEIFSEGALSRSANPAETLKVYNKLLQEQIDELSLERIMLRHHPAFEQVASWLPDNLKYAPQVFEEMLEEANAELENQQMIIDTYNEVGTSYIRRDIDMEWKRLQQEESGMRFEDMMIQMLAQQMAQSPKKPAAKRNKK